MLILPLIILLSSSIFVWPLGILSDRFGLKTTFVLGMVCMSVASIASIVVRDHTMIYIVLALAGLGGVDPDPWTGRTQVARGIGAATDEFPRARASICRSFLRRTRPMSRVRVQSFGISLDGFGAGPAQDLEHPLGVGGEGLMNWAFPTRTLQRMVFGQADGTTGIDDRFAARGFENVGAWILGRNMFSPSRGAWPDEGWKG